MENRLKLTRPAILLQILCACQTKVSGTAVLDASQLYPVESPPDFSVIVKSMYWNIAPTTLKPFTPETNYMSLPGYLRFCTYPQADRWMTYLEAEVVVYLEGYGQYTRWKSVANDDIEKAYTRELEN